MGSADDPRFTALKEKINSIFHIKGWEQIPLKFLGVEMKEVDGMLVDDMCRYINEIRVPEMEKQPADQVLNEADLTKFRQLVMRLRWPAQQVMPHLLYEVSKLAQRVSGATYQDFQDAVKLHKKAVQEAAEGRGCLRYPTLRLRSGGATISGHLLRCEPREGEGREVPTGSCSLHDIQRQRRGTRSRGGGGFLHQ